MSLFSQNHCTYSDDLQTSLSSSHSINLPIEVASCLALSKRWLNWFTKRVLITFSTIAEKLYVIFKKPLSQVLEFENLGSYCRLWPQFNPELSTLKPIHCNELNYAYVWWWEKNDVWYEKKLIPQIWMKTSRGSKVNLRPLKSIYFWYEGGSSGITMPLNIFEGTEKRKKEGKIFVHILLELYGLHYHQK